MPDESMVGRITHAEAEARGMGADTIAVDVYGRIVFICGHRSWVEEHDEPDCPLLPGQAGACFGA